MKITIVGAGDVGAHLADALSRAGHDIVVIENDPPRAAKVSEELDVRVVQGSGSSVGALEHGGANGCDFFLAMTSEDETNLVSASLARAMGANQAFARVHDETFRSASILDYQAHFNINHLLNPEGLAAVEMAQLIRHPGGVAVENFGRGRIEVRTVVVPTSCKAIGRSLADLKLKADVRVGLIQRTNETHVAKADTVIQQGDRITLFGNVDAMLETLPLFCGDALAPSEISVTILGGSEVGVSLAGMLKARRYRVRLIERERDHARRLAERFPHVSVIHGEGTSRRLLTDEQVGKADFFVACTRNDEVNIMTCVQAHKLGVKRNLLSINRADYLEILADAQESLGIELAVSPRLATAREVLRRITKRPFIEVAKLPDDRNTIIEVRVMDNAPCVGRRVREIPWPTNCIVVAQEHNHQVKTPSANDTIHASDALIVIVERGLIPEVLKLVR